MFIQQFKHCENRGSPRRDGCNKLLRQNYTRPSNYYFTTSWNVLQISTFHSNSIMVTVTPYEIINWLIEKYFTNTTENKIYGTGQGTSWSGPIWGKQKRRNQKRNVIQLPTYNTN